MSAVTSEWSESNLDDVRLVERVLAGDADAFAYLVERYKVSVYNLSYRMLGDCGEAEDAAQECFLRAYRQLGTFAQERKFSTWLLAIASHHCVDQLRRRRADWVSIEDVIPWMKDGDPGPEDEVLRHEGEEETKRLLRRLPGKYRVITVLRYWYDLSYEEIGRIVDLPESTVKIRLHRARKMLAEQIESKGGGAGVLSRCW